MPMETARTKGSVAAGMVVVRRAFRGTESRTALDGGLMRGRLLTLALLTLVAAAGCATQQAGTERPIPGMNDTHRVEQINASGARSWE